MATLALCGGQPVRTRPFPQWPIFDDRDRKALLDVLEHDEWGIGAQATSEFEARFADYCGSKHAIACTNGTDAIYIALQALGIGPGDEVIIPPYTFIATAIAVLMVNAVPVFADIDPLTYNLSPAAVRRVLTPQTKALIPVHIGGNPVDLDALMQIADEHRLLVIEDSAQAHGAEWRGVKVGTFGHAATFSFQSSKNLSSGEGGVILTQDDRLAARLRTFTNCGRVEGGQWYDHHEPAGNHRLGAFQSALLNVGLERLEAQMQIRERNAEILRRRLFEIDGISFQESYEGATRHAYHLGILRYQSQEFGGLSRDRFLKALEKEGIPCAAGYLPLYKYALFQHFSERIPAYNILYAAKAHYNNVSCPECDRICAEESIWIFQNMLLGDESDMDDIVEAILKIKQHSDELT